MFRLYNPTNPIVNTKLMNALNNGKKITLIYVCKTF